MIILVLFVLSFFFKTNSFLHFSMFLRSTFVFLRPIHPSFSSSEDSSYFLILYLPAILLHLSSSFILENLLFYQTKTNELDFVCSPEEFIEVKRGNVSPLDFSWFPKAFPKSQLTVVSDMLETRARKHARADNPSVQTKPVCIVNFENFLLE